MEKEAMENNFQAMQKVAREMFISSARFCSLATLFYLAK